MRDKDVNNIKLNLNVKKFNNEYQFIIKKQISAK